MTATQAIRELRLYRPGRPAKAIWLRVFRLDAHTACLQIQASENERDWGEPQRREFSAADEAAIDERLAREQLRWLGEGFQAPGLSLPECAPVSSVPPEIVACLQARLDKAQWRLLAPAKQARVVWRLGELRVKECATALAGLLGSGDNLLDYCLVWALARCGSTAQADACLALTRPGARKGERADAVQRLARLTWLELAPAEARQHYLDDLVEDWPRALRGAWRDADAAVLDAALADASSFERLSFADWLEQLDQLARFDMRARALLHAQLAQTQVAAGSFRALRHLYKAAEMRGDAATWALLARLLESARPTFAGYDNSRPAWSLATRNYFLRRSWRMLRRLGSLSSPEFADMAGAALLRFDDAEPDALSQPPFARSPLFNQLLYRGCEILLDTGNGTAWWSRRPLPANREQRDEAFPALWDQRPDLLVRMLLEARSAPVHAFAALALRDQPSYLQSLDAEVWLRLLNSTYASTAEFALARVQAWIEADSGAVARTPWLILLVGSRHKAVWQAALDWISEDPAAYAADARLIFAMLSARHYAVRQQARLLCQASLSVPGVAEATLSLLLAWLEALDQFSEAPEAIARAFAWALANPLRPFAAQLDYARVLALLDNPNAVAKIVAVECLLIHATPVAALPSSTYKAMLDSADEAVQAAGVRLFGALPDEVLLTQASLVARFCSSAVVAVRTAATAVLERLAPSNPAFAQALAAALGDTLFRAEVEDGVHAHVTGLLTGVLAAGSRALDAALCLRLLLARSRAAQRFGAWLLTGRADADFSTREWAVLGRNDSLEVRTRALQVLDDRLVGDDPQIDEVLGVLDTRWDDAREQALDMLRHKVAPAAWQPARLIALCDHLHPAVQAFGRELIEPRLAGEAVLDYLLPLAEHPAPRMQQFVANWLAARLPDDAALLERLRPYFISVLSQVNRGRAAKSAVQALLRRVALQSEAAARVVTSIFERLVLTVAIADRAQYVAGLYEIRARFPEIDGALKVVAPELRKGAA